MTDNRGEINLATLVSGSSGNATLIASGRTKILVDCGTSGARIEQAMRALCYNPDELRAIFVTHEHIDHIRAVGVMSRRFDLPIYATGGTWQAMEGQIGAVSQGNKRIIESGRDILVDDVLVRGFSISHDANEPLGYRFFTQTDSCAVATDMGTMSKEVFENIEGVRTVLLESNHDIEMLINGPYPEYLKQRIKSDVGHLSNAFCASVCVRLMRSGTKKIMLGHLSEHNNTPYLAYTAAKSALLADGFSDDDIILKVAERYIQTAI